MFLLQYTGIHASSFILLPVILTAEMLFISPHLLILLQATVQCIGARQLAHVLPHFVAHLRYLMEVIKAGLEIS